MTKPIEQFSQDEFVILRGIPISRTEVYLKQQWLEAQPFDVSLFVTESKRRACAQVIRQLDFKYHEIIQARRRPLGENEIMHIDIDDPSWIYIPILLVPPDSTVRIMPTTDRPGGLVAWFRRKKIHKIGGISRAKKTN